MIVLDKPKLKFLLGGRAVTVTVNSDRYRRGRIYAVGTAHNKPSTCTATIQKVKVVAGGYELEILQVRSDQPRLLARNPGAQRRDYVTHPHEAAEGEPEPVDAATLARFAVEGRLGHEARQQREIERQHLRSLAIRLKDAGRRGDVQEITRIRQELHELERDMIRRVA